MKREFGDASTFKVDFVDQSGLGSFELHQHVYNASRFTFLLRLDSYQSNCQRMWLEYRWRFNSLAGAQLQTSDSKQLHISVVRTFSTEESARASFSLWVESVRNDLDVAASERI